MSKDVHAEYDDAFMIIYDALRGKILVKILKEEKYKNLIYSLNLSDNVKKSLTLPSAINEYNSIIDKGWIYSSFINIIRITYTKDGVKSIISGILFDETNNLLFDAINPCLSSLKIITAIQKLKNHPNLENMLLTMSSTCLESIDRSIWKQKNIHIKFDKQLYVNIFKKIDTFEDYIIFIMILKRITECLTLNE